MQMVSRLLIPTFLVLASCCVRLMHSHASTPTDRLAMRGYRLRTIDAHGPSGSGTSPIAPSAYVTGGSIGLLLGLSAGVPVFYWMSRRQRRRLQEQRALLGDELHDQLGPMVYYTRMLVANEIRQLGNPSESMLELQNQLAQTGEAVRDLSKALRNEGATTLAALEAYLAMQLDRWQKLGSSSYSVHGAIPDVTLSLAQYTQLLRVLQEFMLNSCRHAPGMPIHLAFEANRRNLRIRYWDEGRGLDPGFCAGTGSESTLARMQRIGGNLKVDNRFPSGFEIILSLPI